MDCNCGTTTVLCTIERSTCRSTTTGMSKTLSKSCTGRMNECSVGTCLCVTLLELVVDDHRDVDNLRERIGELASSSSSSFASSATPPCERTMASPQPPEPSSPPPRASSPLLRGKRLLEEVGEGSAVHCLPGRAPSFAFFFCDRRPSWRLLGVS